MAPIAVWTRYPWLCGYLAAPIAYHVTSRQASCWSWSTPLLTTVFGGTSSDHAPAAVLAFCWHFHFLRRAAEVAFLNSYHGKGIPDERDSVIEFIYYLIWGLINGCTAACIAADAEADKDIWNVVTSCSPHVILGLVLFAIAQMGNFYCHAHLRYLRPDPADSKWVVPQAFPFSVLVAPHYTFELLGWLGYSLAAGLAPPSILILALSLITLIDCSQRRRDKYNKLYKDGVSKDGSDPASRWNLIPFFVLVS